MRLTSPALHPTSAAAQRIAVEAYEAAARALARRNPAAARRYASIAVAERASMGAAAVSA